MNKYLFFALFSVVLFTSCNDDEITDVRILAEGNWSGTFEGEDSGTWTMVIASDGSLTGELLSTNVPGTAFQGTGTVTSDGKIDAVIMVSTSNSELTGTIDASNARGTWLNSSFGITGTWEGGKE